MRTLTQGGASDILGYITWPKFFISLLRKKPKSNQNMVTHTHTRAQTHDTHKEQMR